MNPHSTTRISFTKASLLAIQLAVTLTALAQTPETTSFFVEFSNSSTNYVKANAYVVAGESVHNPEEPAVRLHTEDSNLNGRGLDSEGSSSNGHGAALSLKEKDYAAVREGEQVKLGYGSFRAYAEAPSHGDIGAQAEVGVGRFDTAFGGAEAFASTQRVYKFDAPQFQTEGTTVSVKFRWGITGLFFRNFSHGNGSANAVFEATVQKQAVIANEGEIEGESIDDEPYRIKFGPAQKKVFTSRYSAWAHPNSPLPLPPELLSLPKAVDLQWVSDPVEVTKHDLVHVYSELLVETILNGTGIIKADFDDTIKLLGVDWFDSNGLPIEPGTVRELREVEIKPDGERVYHGDVISTDGTVKHPLRLPELDIPKADRLTETHQSSGRVNWTSATAILSDGEPSQLETSLPPGAAIRRAFIYTVSNDSSRSHLSPALTVADHTIRDGDWELAARAPADHQASRVVFRAEVTDLVESNGAQSFAITEHSNEIESATLVIVYWHPDEPIRSLSLLDGYPRQESTVNYDAALSPYEIDGQLDFRLTAMRTLGDDSTRIDANGQLVTESLSELTQTFADDSVKALEKDHTRLNVAPQGEAYPYLFIVAANDFTDISLKPKLLLSIDASSRQIDWANNLRISEAGEFEFDLTAEPGTEHDIEFSTDLINWEPLGSVINESGEVTIVDPAASENPQRYYRLRN